MPKVQCPNCKKLTHSTTDAYKPNTRPTRAMVELLEPFKSWGWGDGFNDLECPACEAPLAPSGRLRVVADNHGSNMKKERTEQVVGMFKPITDIAVQKDDKPITEVSKPAKDNLITDMTVDIVPNTCDVCGKVCKSPSGLHNHKRSHKKDN